MADKIVRLANPDEIRRFRNAGVLRADCSVKEMLQQKGFHVDDLVHFLFHAPETGEGAEGKYMTFIYYKRWDKNIGHLAENEQEGFLDLEKYGGIYAARFRTKCLAITHPEAYDRVAETLRNVGFSEVVNARER